MMELHKVKVSANKGIKWGNTCHVGEIKNKSKNFPLE